MDPNVDTARAYRSPARLEQASNTRRRVVDAAHRLFLSEGFAATTIRRRRLRCVRQTVYKNFGSKARLAKAVFDVAIAGDDSTSPVVDREASAGPQRTGPSPQLSLYGEFLASVAPVTCPCSWSSATPPRPTQTQRDLDELQAERFGGMAASRPLWPTRATWLRGSRRTTARDILLDLQLSRGLPAPGARPGLDRAAVRRLGSRRPGRGPLPAGLTPWHRFRHSGTGGSHYHTLCNK